MVATATHLSFASVSVGRGNDLSPLRSGSQTRLWLVFFFPAAVTFPLSHVAIFDWHLPTDDWQCAYFSAVGRGIGILADEPTNIIGRMPMPLSDMKLNAERLGRYDDGR